MTAPRETPRPCLCTTLALGGMLVLALGPAKGGPAALFLMAGEVWRRAARASSAPGAAKSADEVGDADGPPGATGEATAGGGWLLASGALAAWIAPLPWAGARLPVQIVQLAGFVSISWGLARFAFGWRAPLVWLAAAAALVLPPLVFGWRAADGDGGWFSAATITMPAVFPAWLLETGVDFAVVVSACVSALAAGLVFAVARARAHDPGPARLLAGCALGLVFILAEIPWPALALVAAATADLLWWAVRVRGLRGYPGREDRRGALVFHGVLLGGFLLLCGVLHGVVGRLPALGWVMHGEVPVATDHFKGEAAEPKPLLDNPVNTRPEQPSPGGGEEARSPEERSARSDAPKTDAAAALPPESLAGLGEGRGPGGEGTETSGLGFGPRGRSEAPSGPREVSPGWWWALLAAGLAALGWWLVRRLRRRAGPAQARSRHALAGWCLYRIEELLRRAPLAEFRGRLAELREEALQLRYGKAPDGAAAPRLAREVRELARRIEQAERARPRAPAARPSTKPPH